MDSNETHDTNIKEEALDANDYHPMATVAELLAMLRHENQANNYKNEKQQYTHADFVDKKTGVVSTQRVLF